MSIRAHTHRVLELSSPGDKLSDAFDWFMIVLIITNVIAVLLDSIPQIAEAYAAPFWLFDIFSIIIFTIEYALRLWSCVDGAEAKYHQPVWGRLRYMLSPLSIIDLAAILPFYLGSLLGVDLRVLRIFRLFRLLKLTRYSPALLIIWSVFKEQRRALGSAMIIMICALILTATLMFFLEREAQPEAFNSIPHAMWWALATLTTVGYGDVVPVTALGKIFGGMTMVLGIGMFALPTGILATAFANEVRKQEFIVTWHMVARVPLFTGLDAAEIGDVVRVLKPVVVPPRYAVVRVDEVAESMFFIVSGQVSVDVPGQPIMLNPGDFFGEIGLMRESVRIADVVSMTECRLLELTNDDFRNLIQTHPEIHDQLQGVMHERLSELDDVTTRSAD
ncbi:MAG: ion transporter [Rhodospirillales bacterium]|nr:ion transporter [Rhodospirillales bacterium]